jgi:hypothetical protein
MKIVSLLGSASSERTKVLLSLAGYLPPLPSTHLLVQLTWPFKAPALCSWQELLNSHLTPSEHLRLIATLNGLPDAERVDNWLKRASLAGEKRQLYYLPRYTARLSSLLSALWPCPDLLLIDNLANGLSLSASSQLWRFIRHELPYRPRLILYATADIRAVESLGGEVWFMADEQVKHRWSGDDLPPPLRSWAAYTIELRTARAAQRFAQQVNEADQLVASVEPDKPTHVEVLAEEREQIVDLIKLAGPELVNFYTRPLLADDLINLLSDSEFAQSAPAEAEPPHEATPPAAAAPPRQRPEWGAIGQIAASERRRHFRRFWQWFNVLQSSIWLLSLTTAPQTLLATEPALAIALLTIPGALMGLALGLEATGRLATTAKMDDLGQPAQPIGLDRPLSLLAMYDQTAISRPSLLAGLWAGQLLILAIHSWYVTLPFVFLLLEGTPLAAVGLLVLWLVAALTSLALGGLLARLVWRPGQARLLGWSLFILFSILVIPAVRFRWLFVPTAAIFWWWPYAGLVTAYSRLEQPEHAVLPFVFGLAGSALCCFAAGLSFSGRPAIWQPGRRKQA